MILMTVQQLMDLLEATCDPDELIAAIYWTEGEMQQIVMAEGYAASHEVMAEAMHEMKLSEDDDYESLEKHFDAFWEVIYAKGHTLEDVCPWAALPEETHPCVQGKVLSCRDCYPPELPGPEDDFMAEQRENAEFARDTEEYNPDHWEGL
jgi:hypothetical protein